SAESGALIYNQQICAEQQTSQQNTKAIVNAGGCCYRLIHCSPVRGTRLYPKFRCSAVAAISVYYRSYSFRWRDGRCQNNARRSLRNSCRRCKCRIRRLTVCSCLCCSSSALFILAGRCSQVIGQKPHSSALG